MLRTSLRKALRASLWPKHLLCGEETLRHIVPMSFGIKRLRVTNLTGCLPEQGFF